MNNPLVEWLGNVGWAGTDVPSLHAANFNRMVKAEYNRLYNTARDHQAKCSVLCKRRHKGNSRWYVYATANEEYPITEVAEYGQAPTKPKILADIILYLSVKYPDLLSKEHAGE